MRKQYIAMGCPEFSVIRAIRELNAVNDKPYTQREIARYIGCSERTVKRAFRVLQDAKLLSVDGSPKNGYRYRINGREPVLSHTQTN